MSERHAFQGPGVTCEVCGDMKHRPQHAEPLSSKIQLYRCQCGGVPRTQLMGTLVCDRCGNYREDHGQPWPTEQVPSNLVADEFVRQLRVESKSYAACMGGEWMSALLEQAVVKIERLTAELCGANAAHDLRATRQADEIGRLRAVLETLRTMPHRDDGPMAHAMARVADKALTGGAVETTACHHYWIYDSFGGQMQGSVCQKCGARGGLANLNLVPNQR